MVTVPAIPPHASDLYLALGCALGDPNALQLFDAGILADAARVIRRYDSNHAFVTEVMQRIRIHLLVGEAGEPPRIARFDGRASLRAWVGTCAVRMALYVMRGTRNANEIAVEWPDVIAELPTGHAELDAVRARYADAFRTAWRDACNQLTPRHRTILRMCFVENASVEQIATTYAVHRVTVWRWLEDAKTRVLAQTRARLGELIPTTDPGTASLLSLIGSQLDLGLSVLT
ncbi:MAG: sigma-70 family RNA polymerase sigma factor [Deltaproteobacteria bacterium]